MVFKHSFTELFLLHAAALKITKEKSSVLAGTDIVRKHVHWEEYRLMKN